ncbi:1-phosphofructokinase family hexose kinase [Ramlibacter sp. USB13]|uniref:Phosphofructokinase n=1 Tax=Ramlibacter cellulosilyticus TaxID=2764187 RepID=A0A923SB47_9BURK|nr:1-phosphofructokinase family hexose kinase [Ramlibacter cellulosilyticus]MBC5783476.1 1-phosphofructokinase family hexose kinase [Ramlibacter cellulosilyticus]
MADILTLTPNPALDVFTSTARVQPTHKLRCGAPLLHPGGGGINVARVLARLGTGVRALFPSGGVAGQQLCGLLEAEGVAYETLPIAGSTRESFSVREEASGQEYRFVLPGPTLSDAEWQASLDFACLHRPGARLFVASGSLPPGVPDDFYARLARRLAAAGVRLVLDTSGPPLAAALDAGVHLVKPSLRELQELTAQPLATMAQREAACRSLVERGSAGIVALSLGAEGALLVSAQGAWHAPALPVQVVSTIGAGDSFVGGMVFAFARGEDFAAALRHGMAASAAALLSGGTALCQPEDVARLLPQVQVRSLG